MTTDQDSRSRIVLSWLREDLNENAERVLLLALDEVDATPQRRSWWPARRSTQVNRLLIAASAVAAVLVVAIAGFNLLPRGGPGGPPSPSPTLGPTPSPTPTAVPSVAGPRQLPSGPLAAGTYLARPFPTPNDGLEVTFVVPAGWQGIPPNTVAAEAGTGGPDGAAVAFLQPSRLFVDPCQGSALGSPAISAGTTVDDLVRALGSPELNASYDVGTATDVTLSGFSGTRIKVLVPSDVDFETCDEGQYWIWDAGPYAQGVGNRWDLWILDVAGTRVVILAEDFATTPSAVQIQLQEIVGSIVIEP